MGLVYTQKYLNVMSDFEIDIRPILSDDDKIHEDEDRKIEDIKVETLPVIRFDKRGKRVTEARIRAARNTVKMRVQKRNEDREKARLYDELKNKEINYEELAEKIKHKLKEEQKTIEQTPIENKSEIVDHVIRKMQKVKGIASLFDDAYN